MRFTTDYQIGYQHAPRPESDTRADHLAWLEEQARKESADELKDSGRVAEAFDDGCLMPQQLAELVALASQVPAHAPNVTAKLFEAIGMRFVEWVGDTLTNLALEDIRARREA